MGHIQKLVQHFSLPEPPDHYALQISTTKAYITDSDLKSVNFKVPVGAKVQLTKSPRQQALETIKQLKDPKAKKKAAYFLSKQLADLQFLQHFLSENGVSAIIDATMEESAGSTLSYSLGAISIALEYGVGWEAISTKFLTKLCSFCDPKQAINVCTNALVILKTLLSKPTQMSFDCLQNAMYLYGRESGTKPWEVVLLCLDESSSLQVKVKALEVIVNGLSCAAHQSAQMQNEFLSCIQQLGFTQRVRSYVSTISSDDFLAALFQLQHARFELLHAESKELYDKNNVVHEAVLMALWKTVNPNVKLESRVSDQWKELGFQSADPATDFRGMGLIGLKHLLYFAKVYTSTFKAMAKEQAGRTANYYPTAVAGINISQMLFSLLNVGKPQPADGRGEVFPIIFDHDFGFEELYCLVFQLFHRVWDEMNADYMDFTQVSAAIKERTVQTLKDCPNLATFRSRNKLSALTPNPLQLPDSKLLNFPGQSVEEFHKTQTKRAAQSHRVSAPVGKYQPIKIAASSSSSSAASSSSTTVSSSTSSSDMAAAQANLLSGTIALEVYIVPAKHTKTMHFDRNNSIKQCCELICRASKKKIKRKKGEEYGLYLPGGAVWLEQQRKVWSFLLKPNDRVEYKKKSSKNQKIVLVEIKTGASSYKQRISFTSQTSVRGILQAIDKDQKVIAEMEKYGLFRKGQGTNKADVWLDASRTLSAYDVQDQDVIEFKKREGGDVPAPKRIILTIMVPETSSKFVMAFDAAHTGTDIKDRIKKRLKTALTDVSGHALFDPKRNVWLGDATSLSAISGIAMKDVLELKPASADATYVGAAASPSIAATPPPVTPPGGMAPPSTMATPPAVNQPPPASGGGPPRPNFASLAAGALARKREIARASCPVGTFQPVGGGARPPPTTGPKPVRTPSGRLQRLPPPPSIGNRSTPTLPKPPALNQRTSSQGSMTPNQVVNSIVTNVKQRSPQRPPVATPPPAAAASSDPTSKPVTTWTPQDVANWIVSIGYPQFKDVFVDNLVDGDTLMELSTSELRNDLGITALGIRKEILRSRKNLQ